MNDPKGKEISS